MREGTAAPGRDIAGLIVLAIALVGLLPPSSGQAAPADPLKSHVYRHVGFKTAEGTGADDWFIFNGRGDAARVLLAHPIAARAASAENLKVWRYEILKDQRLRLSPKEGVESSSGREATWSLTGKELVFPALIKREERRWTFFDAEGDRFRDFDLTFERFPAADADGSGTVRLRLRRGGDLLDRRFTAKSSPGDRWRLDGISDKEIPFFLPDLKLDPAASCGECVERGGPSSRRFTEVPRAEVAPEILKALDTAKFPID